MNTLIVIHRYVGVVLGVIMTLWCVSGFVMMYQPYPFTTPEERVAGLAALDLSQCCVELAETADAPLANGRIEMLDGAPVLRTISGGAPATYNLASGAAVEPLTEDAVRRVAEGYAAGNGIQGKIDAIGTIRNDQWTVQGARRWQPLWHVSFDDGGDSSVYVNGATGEVVQDANSHERFWNWLGAIPHWLYPTVLRENPPLWNEVVIWSSAIGCFLVITGMVIGFIRLRGRSGKWWPYRNRPMWMWHHVFGTFAGALVLTWTFSGLLTMSPWGLLESEPSFKREEIASSASWADIRPVVAAVAADSHAENIVMLRAGSFMGRPHVMATLRDGSQVRFGAEGRAPFTQGELQAALQARGGQLAAGDFTVLTEEDDYYYGHKRPVEFPVYRLVLDDADQTHIYFNATSGDARVVDATSKRYRWWESGLHSLDFGFMRARPVWDIITLILMALVTIACATGTWLSFTRVGQDFSSIKERLLRK